MAIRALWGVDSHTNEVHPGVVRHAEPRGGVGAELNIFRSGPGKTVRQGCLTVLRPRQPSNPAARLVVARACATHERKYTLEW